MNIMNTLKKYLLLVLLFSILSINISYSQNNWQRAYKGYGNQSCYGYNVVNADNDNYFLLGQNRYSTYVNIYKINKYGDTIFTRYFPGIRAQSITSAGDGNIVIVSSFFNGPYDGLLNIKKLNSQGQDLWNYNFTNTEQTVCLDMIKTTDNFYIICGGKYFEGSALKISNTGEFIWQKTFPTTNYIIYNSVLETSDNCYLLGGNVKDSIGTIGIVEGLLTKIDSSGNKIWEKRYFSQDSVSGIRDLRIIKHQEGYIMGGKIEDSHFNSYIMFNKIDVNGNIKYSHIFPSQTEYIYDFADVKMLSNNRLLFLYRKTPKANTDSLLSEAVISDTLGNIVRINTYSGTYDLGLTRIFISSSNDIMYAGSSNHIFNNMWNAILIKTDTTLYAPPILVNSISTIIPDKFYIKQNYPNPFNASTKIEFGIKKQGLCRIRIYDIIGKQITEITNEVLGPGEYSVFFNAINISSGIYFYSLEIDNLQITKKMILTK